jgi:serine/threonine-protein kinase
MPPISRLRWSEVTSVRLIERGTILLEKYRVDSVIGRGGMGLVVKAWHLGLDEEVAIKMLRDDIAVADETITRFIREAQAAAKLKSEHIARIIDVGTFEGGKPYLVMEFLEGQDLGQLIAECGRLQPSLVIDLVIQACEALAEAHSLGIVHRDIKPANLFLTSRPDGSVLLKILDFGISKSPTGAELSLTQTWSLLGSPAYMSPEQMRSARHVDPRTDIWSLGAVLYETLEGHMPFRATSFSELCVMVAVDSPAPMSATPQELQPIIARCLAKNAAERYASVADLARDLAGLARAPDKALELVDRMYRMLRRGALRRTPPSGIPIAIAALDPSARSSPSIAPPFTAPINLPVVAPPTAPPRLAEPSPLNGVPVNVPHASAAPTSGVSRPTAAMPPFVPRAGSVPPPGYSHPAPRPVALNEDTRYLRPGFEPPRSATASPRGATALMATHMIARSDPRWIITLVTAVLALAAATAVIVATRSAPAAPSILRVTPGPRPAPAGSAAHDDTPATGAH